MAKKLIIAALSARAYVHAAKESGYDVIALDAFADADTRQAAMQTFKIKMNAQGVNVDDFKHIFSQINLDDVEGFLYGSLFDNCPNLLAWVAARVSIFGNTPEVMQAAKSFDFFKLLDTLQIKHLEVSLTKPLHSESWVSKQIGGTGGMHVRPAAQENVGDYYQCKIDGLPVSMLFVADGKYAQAIGFNQQFVAPTVDLPYRFAGAVNNIALKPNIKAAFEHAAQQLTLQLGLRGINSLDAILADDRLWILELNPRLSATFDLYENLLPLHVDGSAGRLPAFALPPMRSKAQLIVYAEHALVVPTNFAWPNWTADIPATNASSCGVKIEKNAPICSVFAQADNAELTYVLVLERARQLKAMFTEMTRK